jgi:hypothetical protein
VRCVQRCYDGTRMACRLHATVACRWHVIAVIECDCPRLQLEPISSGRCARAFRVTGTSSAHSRASRRTPPSCSCSAGQAWRPPSGQCPSPRHGAWRCASRGVPPSSPSSYSCG